MAGLQLPTYIVLITHEVLGGKGSFLIYHCSTHAVVRRKGGFLNIVLKLVFNLSDHTICITCFRMILLRLNQVYISIF